MSTITIDTDVILGQWTTDCPSTLDSSRICTYADLVKKTLPYSSEVLHELNAENNINNVYVFNGRKTLTYQQLSHCNDVKVYLKSSNSAPDSSRNLYRFDGTNGQLSRFSCESIDSFNEKPYAYNQCVVVNDIKPIYTHKQLRFRFRNMTTIWNIVLEPVEGDDSYCSSINITRYADLIDPHDVYMEMLNGRKAKFHFSQVNDTSGIVVYSYSDSEHNQYYPGSMLEYNPTYGGDINVNYTNFDYIESFDCFEDETFNTPKWQTRSFEVEPYKGFGYIEMRGRRNTPIYVLFITDGHVTLRNIPDDELEEVRSAGYGHITEYGTTVIAPPGTTGYAYSTVSQPYFMLLSLQSQDIASWNCWEATIKKYKDDPETGQTYHIDTTIFDSDGGYLLSVNDIEKETGNTLKPGFTYSVEVVCVEAFHQTLVRVIDDFNLEVKYMPNGEAVNEDIKIQSGTKWIHTFYTQEQSVPFQTKDIHLQVRVLEESIEHDNIGPGTDNAIAKVSLSANRQPKLGRFKNESGNVIAIVPYEYNIARVPSVLELYLRLLQEITITFYSDDNGWTVYTKQTDELQLSQSGVTLTFDAEDITSSMLTFNLKRTSSNNNMMSGVFYYNATGTGTPAYGVNFSNLNTIIALNEPREVTISPIIFTLTTFSIRFTSSKQMSIIMKWYLPNFIDAYTLLTKNSDLNIGAYLGTKTSATAIDNTNLNAPSLIVQLSGGIITANSGERTSELYLDSDDTSLPGKMLIETFSLRVSGTMLLFMKRKTTYEGSMSSGYLTTQHLKEVSFELSGSVLIIGSSTFQLTNDSYADVNMSNIALTFTSSNNLTTYDEGVIKIVPKPFENLNPNGECSHVLIEVADLSLPDGTSDYNAWLQPMYISPNGTVIAPGDSSTASPNFYLESTTGNKHTYVLNVPTGHMSMPPRYWKFRFQQKNASTPTHPTKYLYEYDYELRNTSSTIDSSTSVSIGDDMIPANNTYANASSNRKLYMNIMPKVVDVMTVAGIHFWVGNNDYHSAMYLDDAYMPPVVRTAPEGSELYTLLVYLRFVRIDELILSTTQFTLPSAYAGQIQLDKDITGGNVTTNVEGTTYTEHWDLLIKAKVTTDLCSYNNSRVWPSGSETGNYDNAVYYTGMSIPFHLKIDKTSGGSLELDVPVKLGPVMEIYVDNTQGGDMKPHNDETHLVRARGREWYLTSENTIRDHAEYYGTAGGYKYYAKFLYNSNEIPNNNDVTDPIKSRRTGRGFDITAPTTWTETDGTVHSNDWGAWQIKVIDETQLESSGTMVVMMEITNDGSPIKMYNWYPAKLVNIEVFDFMSIGNVSWWDGSSNQTSNIKNAFLSPVTRGTTTEVASMSLTFPSNHGLNLNSTYITSIEPISITTTVSAEVVLDVKIFVNEDLGIYNDNLSSRIFYTGMQVPFYVTIAKTAGGNFTDTFYMKLGPVLAFANTVASGRFADYENYPYGESFSSFLKPTTSQKIVLQSRAHEWYLDDSGNIMSTPNSAVGESAYVNRTVRGRQYVIEWSYNKTSLTETAASSRPYVDLNELVGSEKQQQYQYSREFTYSSSSSINLRILHAASWTGLDLSRYFNDGGAWRVYVENDNGLDDGILTAHVVVNDESPEIGLHHWYDGGKITTLPVNDTMYIVGSEYLYGDDGDSYESVDCGTTLTNLILTDYNAWRAVNEPNINIYINNSSGCDIEMTYNNEADAAYFNIFLRSYVYDISGELTNGSQYTNIVGYEFQNLGMPLHPLYPMWDSVTGKRMYSGKTIDMTLTGKLNGEVVASYPVCITVGTFGRIYYGISGRIVMSNEPGTTLSIAAFGEIVERNGSTSETVMYVPDNVNVKGELDITDSESTVVTSYNNSNGVWTFTVPTTPAIWAKGRITIKQRIMKDWYDEFETKDIVFQKFINFYTEDYNDKRKSVALCSIDNSIGTNMFSISSSLTDNSTDFSNDSITVRDINNVPHTVYYMTFLVTIDNEGHTIIYRIYQNTSEPLTTSVLVGELTTRKDPVYAPKQYKVLRNSDFSMTELNNENYEYGTNIRLLNPEPSKDSSQQPILVNGRCVYSKYEPSSSSYIYKSTVNWNYKWSNNTLQSLDTTELDDYPIWNSQWRIH